MNILPGTDCPVYWCTAKTADEFKSILEQTCQGCPKQWTFSDVYCGKFWPTTCWSSWIKIQRDRRWKPWPSSVCLRMVVGSCVAAVSCYFIPSHSRSHSFQALRNTESQKCLQLADLICAVVELLATTAHHRTVGAQRTPDDLKSTWININQSFRCCKPVKRRHCSKVDLLFRLGSRFEKLWNELDWRPCLWMPQTASMKWHEHAPRSIFLVSSVVPVAWL